MSAARAILVQATAEEKRFAVLVNQDAIVSVQRYEQAKAALDTAVAQLAAAEAQVTYASSNLSRNQRLIESNAVAHQELELAENEARTATANVLAARAAVEAARLDLEYTRITAPVSGRISRAEVTAGNVVAAGSGTQVLTSIVSVTRLYASFDVDEQTYLKYVQLAAEVNWLIDHVRWDAEEDLSRLIGDAPAHTLAQAARQAASALRSFVAKRPGTELRTGGAA